MNRLLQVSNVDFRTHETEILKEITFSLEAGTRLGLIGPNGCGKSTLLKLLSGVLNFQSGSIQFQGQDLLLSPLSERVRKVAYVGSELTVEFPLSAQEAVELGVLKTSAQSDAIQQSIREAMERCSCWSLRDRDVMTLSGGERQLVLLARSLVTGAKILFFDESFSKMDLHHQTLAKQLMRELSEEGRAIILVSHDLGFCLECVDSVALMDRGSWIRMGKSEEVLEPGALERLYPGARIKLGKNPFSGRTQLFFE